MRFLQRLVEGGRWDEAKGYMSRFMPSRHQMGVEARTALRFIALLNILDDLAHGNPAGAQLVQLLDRRLDAHPSVMDADPHCAEIIRTIFHVHSHPELRWPKSIARSSSDPPLFLVLVACCSLLINNQPVLLHGYVGTPWTGGS